MIFAILIIVIAIALYWLFMSSYSQVFGNFQYKSTTKNREIALTFDDGPNEPYTSDLLKILKSENVLATFFLVGSNVLKYPKISQKIHSSGHLIGNHSMNHKFMNSFYIRRMSYEIELCQNTIKNTVGVMPKFFRPPWLFRSPGLFKVTRENKMIMISGVFCNAFEVFQPNAEYIAKKTVNKVHPGSIIIFHDGVESKGGDRSKTVESVRLVIDELKKQNFTFVTVDKLLGIKEPYNS